MKREDWGFSATCLAGAYPVKRLLQHERHWQDPAQYWGQRRNTTEYSNITANLRNDIDGPDSGSVEGDDGHHILLYADKHFAFTILRTEDTNYPSFHGKDCTILQSDFVIVDHVNRTLIPNVGH